MGPICRVISGSNFFMKFWPSLLINLQDNISRMYAIIKHRLHVWYWLAHLSTVLARMVLQDFRYFRGQHFPRLGKRHSSSAWISFSSTLRSEEVISILPPSLTPSLMTRVKSTFLPANLPLQYVNVKMINCLLYFFYPTFRLLSTCRGRSWEESFHKESRFR